MDTLEFPTVLQRLARLTAFAAGREHALALRPLNDRETVLRRQRETAEAVALANAGAEVPLGGAHDVRARARTAALGHVLTPAELLEIAATARCAGRVQRALARRVVEAPLLAALAAGIADLAPLRALIDGAITERAAVADDASPELRTIRRELAEAHERLHQRMQALLASPDVRAALQDAIVTVREGRYVLPVRAEARSAVRGVVHDTSASGATVFVEPLAVIDLGNRWRELQAQERHEIERVLRALSAGVGDVAEELVDAVERLADVDVALAKARLAAELRATTLAVPGPAQPWLVEPPAALRLVEARHPLLAGEVVPVTIEVGGAYRALLITGPNTGGKTVALKTAGLLCAMALAGLPVPAGEGTLIPVYDAIFADIGDEQSIEQSLSTFSGHITAIIDVIERAGPRSLVLLDELGAGTDPTEGAALAIAIVDRLIAAGATLVATTHHGELKLYAHRNPQVMNASVEFDVQTLAPTYRLTIGVPGRSNALAIAARLGMPPDVIAAARAQLSSEQRDLTALLGDLQQQLAAAEERTARAAEDRDRAQALRADLERRLEELVQDTARQREEAQRRVREELHEVERLFERVRHEVESARLAQAAADLDRARAAATQLAPEPPPAPRSAAGAAILPGHAVWLRGIALPGEVLTVPNAAGEFEVRLGSLRTRVRTEQVERSETRVPGAVAPAVSTRVSTPTGVPEEIEVRGQTLDEALPAVEQFLDLAARAGHAHVRLIHGRGTGTLRRAVRALLERHPLVTGFETAEPREGGEGVTVAHLAATSR